ncbi:MAG: SRPBCC family protein [Acidobacteriota bacterium]
MNSLTLGSLPRSRETGDGATLSRALGWFGIALGAAELAVPAMLARAIGIRADRRSSWILRAFGVREIAAGLGILMRPRRPLPVWSRVLGDVLDVALLGTAALTRRRSGPRVIGALAAVAGAGVLDVVASRRVQRASAVANRPVMFAVTIAQPPREVYDFYRDLAQLPVFMDYLESVVETGPRTSHWVAKTPIGGRVEWDAEITTDQPDKCIAWRSVEGSSIETTGMVTFQELHNGHTEVRVEMQLGGFGEPSAALARWFAQPQIKGDLRRLKQVLEAGEVLRSDAGALRMPHPAQPDPTARKAPPTFRAKPPAGNIKGGVS